VHWYHNVFCPLFLHFFWVVGQALKGVDMSQTNYNKLYLGKILGEIYRIQRSLNIPSVDDATIYALLHGFESVADEELENLIVVTKEQQQCVTNVLLPYFEDPAKLANFKGYYDIEKKLEAGGVDRPTAIAILIFFKAKGQFTNVIAKMDSSDSPCECRTLELEI